MSACCVSSLPLHELLLNETFEHPEQGRLALGRFTPAHAGRYVVQKLVLQAQTDINKAARVGQLIAQCPRDDMLIIDQL